MTLCSFAGSYPCNEAIVCSAVSVDSVFLVLDFWVSVLNPIFSAGGWPHAPCRTIRVTMMKSTIRQLHALLCFWCCDRLQFTLSQWVNAVPSWRSMISKAPVHVHLYGLIHIHKHVSRSVNSYMSTYLRGYVCVCAYGRTDGCPSVAVCPCVCVCVSVCVRGQKEHVTGLV